MELTTGRLKIHGELGGAKMATPKSKGELVIPITVVQS
jgi:hypothetical protein